MATVHNTEKNPTGVKCHYCGRSFLVMWRRLDGKVVCYARTNGVC